jgi:peptide chain release factor 1
VLDKLNEYEQRYDELGALMADLATSQNPAQYQKLAREMGDLQEVVDLASQYRAALTQLEEAEEIIADGSDAELVELAAAERDQLRGQVAQLEETLKVLLIPKDPNDGRNAIVEIRAGTGGDEAGLFASDLYRAYSRYAQLHNWTIDVMDTSPSTMGGFNKIIFEVQGKGAFSRLKFERGVHRVQRIPDTETQGRIHTSTATVVVLPEADEVDVKVNPEDLRIDVFHAGGHGGQNVNKVATAIRIVHEPSGLTVVCQDERSQHKNKTKAMAMLRARIYEAEEERKAAEMSQTRRAQVGSAERSEKIRTYNYPQDRITDHRINSNFHGMPKIMDGYLDDIIDSLTIWGEEQALIEGAAQ